MKYYTSIEQSKKLLELGLDPNTADMEYLLHRDDGSTVLGSPFIKDDLAERGEERVFDYLPCWSVGALIDAMPMIKYKDYPKEYPILRHWDGYQFDTYAHATQYYDNLIEAAYEMVIWLLKNNYIKKK